MPNVNGCDALQRQIRQQLEALAEPGYRAFSCKLLPGIENILGVRLPALRKMAAEIVRGGWRQYLSTAEHDWFEQIMLHGMVIGLAPCDVSEKLAYAASFIPLIDNWSVCDSFCAGLKCAATHPEQVWAFLQPYLQSQSQYALRFGVVMLLHYVDQAYLERVLAALRQVRHEGYYVRMAVAWVLCECYLQFPQRVGEFLQQTRLDDFTFRKTLSKILESNRADAHHKAEARAMRTLLERRGRG